MTSSLRKRRCTRIRLKWLERQLHEGAFVIVGLRREVFGFLGVLLPQPVQRRQHPGWYDVDEQYYAVNSYYFYNADRVRHQANASLTKFASGFAGDHNLKFGAEFERSYVKSERAIPAACTSMPAFGVPYYAYLWDGYLKDNINNRFTAFAQDSWTIGPRLTLNPGVRFDRITGFNKHLDEQVFATNSISPRIGFAWDVDGQQQDGHSRTLRLVLRWCQVDAITTCWTPRYPRLYGAYIDANFQITDGPYLIRAGHEPHMDPRHQAPANAAEPSWASSTRW